MLISIFKKHKICSNRTKKGVYTAKGEGNDIRGVIFISVLGAQFLHLCVEREIKLIRKRLIHK